MVDQEGCVAHQLLATLRSRKSGSFLDFWNLLDCRHYSCSSKSLKWNGVKVDGSVNCDLIVDDVNVKYCFTMSSEVESCSVSKWIEFCNCYWFSWWILAPPGSLFARLMTHLLKSYIISGTTSAWVCLKSYKIRARMIVMPLTQTTIWNLAPLRLFRLIVDVFFLSIIFQKCSTITQLKSTQWMVWFPFQTSSAEWQMSDAVPDRQTFESINIVVTK